MSKQPSVGFNQRIQLEWLNYVVELVLAGHGQEEIRAELDDYLKDKLSIGGNGHGSNRSKAIGILFMIWVTAPEAIEAFHAGGLEFLKSIPKADWLPVHWGMLMAVYPFFTSVSETIGRLQRLQGSIATVQFQRRIREQFGERETTARASQRILRSFIDWGVLLEAGKKGEYQASTPLLIQNRSLAVWLVEALLHSSNTSSGTLKALIQSPALFPFELPTILSARDIEGNPRLEVFRQGLDVDVLRLNEEIQPPPIGGATKRAYIFKPLTPDA